MTEIDREIQKRNLIALAKSPDGFKFTPTFFPYTSGEIGPYYVQSAGIMADGKAYATACDDMATLVSSVLIRDEKYDGIISGGESRDWIFSGPIAARLSLPHTMIYKDGKVIGAPMKGRLVAHVADLNNEGSSPRDMWIPTIKKEGGIPANYIFFFVDRLEDGVGEMKKLGLESHSVIPLDSYAWDCLQEIGVLNQDVYRSLQERMEDKRAWAVNMLKSEPGLETLVALVASGKTREKGIKIIQTYKEISEELTDRMRKIAPGARRWVA